ncbi:MAG: hypothetical protein O9327_03255 [Polaromonas sp.]|nr:hypothetical protein [Polaromonas sp.]
MEAQSGARQRRLEAEFLAAARGIGLASVKKALREESASSDVLAESSKARLAIRYAKGKLSRGGDLESQFFRKMDISVFKARLRRFADVTQADVDTHGRPKLKGVNSVES